MPRSAVGCAAILASLLPASHSASQTFGVITAELEVTLASYVDVEDPNAEGLPDLGDTLDFVFTYDASELQKTQPLPFLWQTSQPLVDLSLQTRGVGAGDRFAALAETFEPNDEADVQYTANTLGLVGLGLFPFGMKDPIEFQEPEFELDISGLTTDTDPSLFELSDLPMDMTPAVQDGTVLGRLRFRSRAFAGEFDSFVEASLTGLTFATLIVDPAGGDFNGDGAVDNGDLNLLLGSWGESNVPTEWVNGFVAPVDNGELNLLLGDWGAGVGIVATPEPTTAVLLLAAVAAGAVRRW